MVQPIDPSPIDAAINFMPLCFPHAASQRPFANRERTTVIVGSDPLPSVSDAPAFACQRWHRYQFAGLFVADKRVLDLGCGDGCGASFLSRRAKSVVGIDFDDETIHRASSKYVSANLSFRAGTPGKMPIDVDQSIDVVVSFDVVGRLSERERRDCLAEAKRLLAPGGLLIVSTPNRLSDDRRQPPIEPWANGIYYDEFRDFLQASFRHVAILSQAVETGSFIECLANQQAPFQPFYIKRSGDSYCPAEEPREAQHLLALCSDNRISGVPSSLSVDLSRTLAAGRDERIFTLKESTQTLMDQVAERERSICELTAKIEEDDHVIDRLMAQLTEGDRALQTVTAQLIERDQVVESLKAQVADDDRSVSNRIAERDRLFDSLSTQLAAITRSKAWRLVLLLRKSRVLIAPPNSRMARALRRLARAGVAPFRRLKTMLRRRGTCAVPPGSDGVEQAANNSAAIASGASSPGLIDLDTVAPYSIAPGRIAIHLHLFHPELADEFAGYFGNVPFPYDLFVSVADKAGRQAADKAFASLPHCQGVKIEIVPNRGRDIAPLFCVFGKELMSYDFIAHLHGNKSGDCQGEMESGREYLCGSLLGSEQRVRKIFTLMSGGAPAGIVYPQTHRTLPCWANTWLANRSMGVAWCRRLGIDRVPRSYLDYPVGAMFWARTAALRPLFTANLTLEDFPREAGQNDGTAAHCLERLPVLVAQQQGFRHAILKDAASPSWSSWRIDQCPSRNLKTVQKRLSDPQVRVVAFDIFDTLLVRPLLDPEAIKEIVARRAPDRLAELYRRYRSTAETAAREKASLDVGLQAIYSEFVEQSGVSLAEADTLRRLEEEVERHAVALRPDALAMLQLARKAGKRIVLLSDMFLPRATLESMLKEQGVTDWDAMYLSNDVGLRKDTGDLYGHVLDKESLTPQQLLMIGDNERSDVQIPHDLGIGTLHVLRPIETARALPRLRPFVEKAERGDDLDAQLTLGLLLRNAYSPIFHQELDPASMFPTNACSFGYSLVGPLVAGFVSWLAEQARHDDVDCLHFLSREGLSLKLAYDRWYEAFHDGPPSEYLVLSRRATTVPAIAGHDDILNIARTDYSANTARCFLDERFGLDLPAERWAALYAHNRWSPDRTVEIHGEIGADVLQLLAAVQPDILAHAAAERPPMLAYLRKMGFHAAQRTAIVDIGYSATVQDRVNLLLGEHVHGYYMMTSKRANTVRDRYGCIVRGCFFEGADTSVDAPPMYLNSFTLEKMLGSSEGQLIRYTQQDGDVIGVHRPLSKSEREGNQARLEIRKGMLQYMDDVVQLRAKVFPDFRPPLALPQELFVALVGNQSPAERAVIRQLVLDDFYCGQGLV
ncbi:MAG: rhamnan synthesis F family protein [Thermoguttaceae bacterium]